MTQADLPAVLAVADVAHPGFPEDVAVFAERLALFPAGCLVLERAGQVAAYVLSHPWRFCEPPALNSLLGELPEQAGTLYLHDIALAPSVRGTGAPDAALGHLHDTARKLGAPNLSLVAVNGSVPYWSRHGFAVVDDPQLAPKLASYGGDARFMVRELGDR